MTMTHETARRLVSLLDITDDQAADPDRYTIVDDLKPSEGRQQSFYGKAQVLENPDGTRTLVSYQTMIMTYDPATGKLTRHWPDYSWQATHGRDWTPTTGRHIADFTQQMTGQRLNKAEFMGLALEGDTKNEVQS